MPAAIILDPASDPLHDYDEFDELRGVNLAGMSRLPPHRIQRTHISIEPGTIGEALLENGRPIVASQDDLLQIADIGPIVQRAGFLSRSKALFTASLPAYEYIARDSLLKPFIAELDFKFYCDERVKALGE